MGEKKVDIQELAQKVEELQNILNVISGDLAEVVKELKKVNAAAASPEATVVRTEQKRSIDGVKKAFSPELAGMLLFEDRADSIILKRQRFLESDDFAKIASIVRELGGEYISAGKNSHFKIPK